MAADYYRQPIVADLLRLQALIFLATPFIALPEALLIRELDFKRPAIANLSATFVSAVSRSPARSAGSGCGRWSMRRCVLLDARDRARARGAVLRAAELPLRRRGADVQFGLMLLGGYFFWTILTQADVFIAARFLIGRTSSGSMPRRCS